MSGLFWRPEAAPHPMLVFFFSSSPSPSCTICVLKDGRVLDEGHVPCILHKAPVTQEGRLAIRKTVLLQGQARRPPCAAARST